MSIQSVLARIDQLENAFAPPPASQPQQTTTTAPTSFSDLLAQAGGASAVAPVGAAGGVSAPAGSVGGRMVQIAESQVGQGEQPPGSNDSPAIAMYRSATAGATPGAPWCAYFVSWVAQQAGVPLGPGGQGFGSVDQLWSWAQQTGKAVQPGQQPQPGDLIVFPEHVGIVERVLPGGQLETIEGNYSNQVSQVIRSPSEAIGFVRLG